MPFMFQVYPYIICIIKYCKNISWLNLVSNVAMLKCHTNQCVWCSLTANVHFTDQNREEHNFIIENYTSQATHRWCKRLKKTCYAVK